MARGKCGHTLTAASMSYFGLKKLSTLENSHLELCVPLVSILVNALF